MYSLAAGSYDLGMFRIIYVSSAVAPLSEQQLEELLQKSRRHNLELGVTGMLLYKDGNFMQTLEGPMPAVQTLTEKIRNDPRHHKFNILMNGLILERAFGSWSMGFKKIMKDTVINIPGYHDSDDFSLMSSRFIRNPPRSLELLLSFNQEN